MQLHADTVFRVCMMHLGQKADAEDAFQDTFVRYARSDVEFADEEHRRAWLIRVATNVCRDMLKSSARSVESLDDESADKEGLYQYDEHDEEEEQPIDRSSVVKALGKLDERYRIVLYLKYYENYSAAQIADMLDIPINTVYTNVARGKELMREALVNDGA